MTNPTAREFLVLMEEALGPPQANGRRALLFDHEARKVVNMLRRALDALEAVRDYSPSPFRAGPIDEALCAIHDIDELARGGR